MNENAICVLFLALKIKRESNFYQERVFAFELAQLNVNNPLSFALTHESGKLVRIIRLQIVAIEMSRLRRQTSQLEVAHRVAGRFGMMHSGTRHSGSMTFSSSSENSKDVNVTGSYQILLLLLQSSLLVDGVVVDEVVAERFAILVVEGIAVSRILTSSCTNKERFKITSCSVTFNYLRFTINKNLTRYYFSKPRNLLFLWF